MYELLTIQKLYGKYRQEGGRRRGKKGGRKKKGGAGGRRREMSPPKGKSWIRHCSWLRGRWPMQISNVSGGAGKGQEDKISSNESDDRLCYGL